METHLNIKNCWFSFKDGLIIPYEGLRVIGNTVKKYMPIGS